MQIRVDLTSNRWFVATGGKFGDGAPYLARLAYNSYNYACSRFINIQMAL